MWHTFQSNCSLKENDFCIWRPFSLLRQVMQVALTEKYSSIQFPFPHYYINIISSLHWHALITTLPLYFASSRNYKPRRRKYVLLAFSCFFLSFQCIPGGNFITTATIVNVNTYIRSIEKIDDYKMVSLMNAIQNVFAQSVTKKQNGTLHWSHQGTHTLNSHKSSLSYVFCYCQPF